MCLRTTSPCVISAAHSLADHRREFNIERLGGVKIYAADGFQLVVSYNPGYQSVLKDLKMSTRQRLVGIDLGFPPLDAERNVLLQETPQWADTRRHHQAR